MGFGQRVDGYPQTGRPWKFSQQLSADHLVLELHRDEHCFRDVADRGRVDHDSQQDAPALGHPGEAAFARAAQQHVTVFVLIANSPQRGVFTGTSTPGPAPS